MAGTKPRLVAWDSCVFLAWFKQEVDKPLAEIELILRDILSGRITLLVSAVVAAEVLDEAGVTDAGTQFREFCRRSTVSRLNVDFRMGELAATYRQAAGEARKQGEIKDSFKAPDALIVATAVVYKAEILHTFDPLLLQLSGSPILGGLRTARPDSGYAHGLHLSGLTD